MSLEEVERCLGALSEEGVNVCALSPGWVWLRSGGGGVLLLGSVAGGIVAVGIFAVGVVGVPGGWWPHQNVRVVVVVCGLTVASLSLPVVFCSGPRFPSVLVAWSLEGLGFFVVLEVLFLLGDVWGFVFGDSLW